jgi:hypothetical protein
VRWSACLKHQLHTGLADVQVDPLTYVLDVEQVRAAFADQRQQPRERPGPMSTGVSRIAPAPARAARRTSSA